MQRTLALFRPAAVESGLAHKLLSCAVDTGLRVSLRKTLLLSVKVRLGVVPATEDRYFVMGRVPWLKNCAGLGAIPSLCCSFSRPAFTSIGCARVSMDAKRCH